MSTEMRETSAEAAPYAAVNQALEALAEALKGTPAFQALLGAARAMSQDDEVQDLYWRMADHQSAIRWGRGNLREHLLALRDLEDQLNSHPCVQAYLQAMESTQALFRAVDAIISERAGVDFGANAKRSCCG